MASESLAKTVNATDSEVKAVASIDEEKQLDHELVGRIVPGSEGVTEEELETLRHLPDRLPARVWLIAFVEFAERWTYYGTTNIFPNYLRQPLPLDSKDGHVVHDKANGIAGALGMGFERSFALRTFNTFWVYVTPWIGAFVADLTLGRFNTILVFSIVAIAGHVVLVGGASPSSLENVNGAIGLTATAILIMGIGAGSIKSCISPLIAEQYTGKLRRETLSSGEVVLRSPSVTYQSIYLWFYLFINLGSCGAVSASFLARDNGYWVAFLVPTCIFLLTPGTLLLAKKYYVITPPRGSILLETFRVLFMCVKNSWSWNPFSFVKATKRNDFWDVAKPGMYEAGALPAKITWDDEFVGEVDRTMKACTVFLFFPFYFLCYSQIDNNLANVAAGMTLNGTPNDVLQVVNPLALIVFIPMMDYLFYPFLRRQKIAFTPIKRIMVGFFVAGTGMVYAAVLQKYIYESSPCHDNHPAACETSGGLPNPSPLNVWIIAGPYILLAISEIFANITSLEYAFTKFQQALSSALNFALTAVNVEERYTWLFGSFAVVAFICGILFYIAFRPYDKIEEQLNQIGTGNRKGFAGETPEMTTGLHGAANVDAPPAELPPVLETVAHGHLLRKSHGDA